MFKTKKEVDAHVRTALAKIRTDAERHLRGLTIAKLYFKINEYATAEQYLTSYLSVKEDNDQAHKLLGQCYQRLKKPDKALQAFQHSLHLNPKQPDVLGDVCQLLLDDNNLNSNKAKYWCELAESEKVNHDAVFSLRFKLVNKDHLGSNQVEEMLQKEISARPYDVQLRVRLVRNYVEKNQILDAFRYIQQLEMGHNDDFLTSSEWYNIVWLVLNKYEQMPTTTKDWIFWLLVATCLERQIQISFNFSANSILSGGGVTETANLVFNLDQYLFKISQLSSKLCAQKELIKVFLDHYRGQLLLHAAALIFKRELLQNKNKWKETTRSVLPLMLLAYQIEPPENNEPWMKHCDEHSKRLIDLWQKEGSFRCVQMGRTLLSCINDDSNVDKENAFNMNYILPWQNNDELLAQVRQMCSERQWRHNIFALLFCNSDQKIKEQSSLFAKSSQLSEPLYELPTYADIERYEDAAQYLRPQSLQHMVYLCLGNENWAYIKVKYFSGLNFSTHNLSFCGAESLNQLDVDSFVYAASIQAKRALEVERDVFESYQSGNSLAGGKPKMLPFVNIQNVLCTEEQSQWWNAAYMVYKNLSDSNNLAELRALLQYGIEAVRGINGPKSDMAIVFKMGQLFVARAQDIVKPIEKTFLEARAECLYKHGLNMMKMYSKGVLEPFRKYFKYFKNQSSAAERELFSAAEDAASYLATRYFKKSEYEDLIEELSGIQLPIATYLQAEAYRQLDEASKTPKKNKRMYLERASECLNQTLNLLKSRAHADPNHPLNSIIHSEIKRLQQASARYLHDSNTNYSPLAVHNNSSAYEDAEDDFFDENAALPAAPIMNSTRARRDNIASVTALISTHSKEMENLVTQVTETFKLELGNVTKEISTLKEKISNLEDTVRKVKIYSNPPSRDDASNVLDDLYLIEDTLQQQLYQQPQASNTNPHMNAQQYGSNQSSSLANGSNMLPNSPFLTQHHRLQAAAAFNNSIFSATHNFPVNFYGHPNQTNPYIMAPQPGAPPTNQRSGHLGPFLDPSVAMPSQAGLSFAMPSTTTPLLQPQNQPAAALAPLTVEPNKQSNLYSLLQQITPSINNPIPPSAMPTYSSAALAHTSLSMSVAAANTTPTNIPPSISVQIHKPLNNQQVEKGPPANVVITSSDPLPNPNTISIQSQQQPPLSVTIPSHHIKPSLISQPPLPPQASSSITFGTPIGTSAFSFKQQILATAIPQTTSTSLSAVSENLSKTSDSAGSDFNRSVSDDADYDPRPDFKAIIPLPDEIEVRTGEENEEIMFCHRAKLFRHLEREWKERGIGDIKILKNKEGPSRILMRRDQTYKICANHVITPELILTVPKNETKGFIWAANDFADESLKLEKFLVRFKLPETAKQFQDAFEKAQNDAKAKPTIQNTKGEGKHKCTPTATSQSTIPFSLPKSNLTNFATSTPALKGEKGTSATGKTMFGQPLSSATSATTNSTSKSLFSGLNLSTKTYASNEMTLNKPAGVAATALPSPFDNFTFGESVGSSDTATTVTTATSVVKTSTATASPFATIFSNLSTSPFTNMPSSTTASSITTTTVSGAVQAVALNKSSVSDTEDDYVPTAQFNPVIPLPDLVEVNTGEENELVLFEHRAKLLRFDKQAEEWKERGLGNIKLLQDKDNANKVRLVMRREQIHKLCCNQLVYKDTTFKYVKNCKTALSWAGQDFSENELVTEMLTVRFKLPETCKEFLEAIQQAQAKMNNDSEEANSNATEKKTHTDENNPTTKGFAETFKPEAGSWSCETCYISNDAEKLYCIACDTPKDSTVSKKESNSDILITKTTNKFSFGFSASPAAGEQISTTTGKPGFGTMTTTSSTPKNGTKSNEPASSAPIGFGNAFKPKAGSWTCETCYVINDADILHCNACNCPKDNIVPKNEDNENILATSNNVPKFSFGFGSSVISATPKSDVETTTTTRKSQSTSGFGDAFKPKAGSWTCQDCYVSNTADVVYCTSCDAAKDDAVPKKENNTNVLALTNPSQKFSFGFANNTNNTSPTASGDSRKPISTGFSFSAAPLASTDNAKSFTFTPPVAPATSTTIGKSTFSFSLSSTAMETPTVLEARKESSRNTLSLDKKEFNFTLKSKSPGKNCKSPMKFEGGVADTAAEEDGGETDYHEEEENNTYFTPVIPLPDKIAVKTGEEDEELLYVHRAKLYRFIDGEWKERGVGNVKILRHKENKKLRVVMRRDHIFKICLNHMLNEYIAYKRKDDKSWLFVANDFSEGAVELEKFSLRFKTKEVAKEFMEAVKRSLDGTAEVIESQANVSTVATTQPPVIDLEISEEDKKMADKLKLPYDFFLPKTITCAGCKGCDPENFEFPDVKNTESFINKEDIENQLDIMELPNLVVKSSIPKTNRTLIKQSTLSPATDNAVAASKSSGSIFSGFGGANSTAFTSNTAAPPSERRGTDKSINNFSFTAALNSSTSKPVSDTNSFGTAGSGGFLFGSGSKIPGSGDASEFIFGGTKENNSIFSQKPAIFGGGAIASSNADNKEIKSSMFGGSGSNSGPIFGGKSIFGSAVPSFASSTINDGNNKSLFGNSLNSTQSTGGSSIFGSATNTTGFGGFLSKDDSGSPQTTFADLAKTSAANVDFSSLATNENGNKVSVSVPAFADLSNTSGTIDFATLAKAGSAQTAFGIKSNDKAKAGASSGFIGLTHENVFSSFQKPIKELQTADKNASTKTSVSLKSIQGVEEGGENNEETYDPHYEPIIELPDEMVVSTGEEEETKVFGERAVLYRFDDTNKEWKERGIGELKILFHPQKQSYRLVMRREQILKLVLNHGINSNFTFNNLKNNPKSLSWAAFNYAESSEGVLEKLVVRFPKLEVATQFATHLNEAIKVVKEREGSATTENS